MAEIGENCGKSVGECGCTVASLMEQMAELRKKLRQRQVADDTQTLFLTALCAATNIRATEFLPVLLLGKNLVRSQPGTFDLAGLEDVAKPVLEKMTKKLRDVLREGGTL